MNLELAEIMRRPDDASATTTTAIASKNTYVFHYPSHEKVQESEFFCQERNLPKNPASNAQALLERLGFRHNFIFANSACLFILCDFLV